MCVQCTGSATWASRRCDLQLYRRAKNVQREEVTAILDFTDETALPISETVFLATGHIIGTNIMMITHIEANI